MNSLTAGVVAIRYIPLLLCLNILLVSGVFANTTVTYRSSESVDDDRYEYDRALLKLALQQTVPEYGVFNMVPSPAMNNSRAVLAARNRSLPNFVVKLSYSYAHPEALGYIPFPVDLGIVGYRVCFTSRELRDKVADIDSVEKLKGFVFGQGRGWTDVEILRHHGFQVVEVPLYASLFGMVAGRRFDLLCRGPNEFLGEWEANRHIESFIYDESLVIHYALPRFFYVHESNRVLMERIEKGLKKAYADGSLKQLWLKHYRESIEFTDLKSRRIFRFENPTLKGLDPSYEMYLYDPYK